MPGNGHKFVVRRFAFVLPVLSVLARGCRRCGRCTTAWSQPCRIVKNPPAIRVSADSHALGVLSRQRFCQRSRYLRERPVAIPLYWKQLCPPPILALDEPLPHRYVESVIQFCDFTGAQRVSRGQLLRGAAQQLAQILQSAAGRAVKRDGGKFPMFPERRQPFPVIQMIRAFAESVPLLAVRQVKPGSDVAESVRVKNVMSRFHGNALNPVDSLQRIGYPPVMSIAAIKHYNNRRSFPRFPCPRWRS